MIYLLKSPSWKPGYVVYKVGFTTNLERRLSMYSPLDQLLSIRDGDIILEQLLHRRIKLIDGINKIFRNEWYEVESKDPRIPIIFHESWKKMEKLVWKSMIVSEELLSSFIRTDLWDYLYNKYHVSIPVALKEGTIPWFQKKYSDISRNTNLLPSVRKFFSDISKLTRFSFRLKSLCERDFSKKELNQILLHLLDIDPAKKFYLGLGSAECKKCTYNPTMLKEKLEMKSFPIEKIACEIYKEFNVGVKISYRETKIKIGKIYKRIGYSACPKSVDILEYFETKKAYITDKALGKRVKGYELIKKLL